jgi:4-hydroxy-3-methylbut-2-enyl diphosphate reductase
VTVRLAGLQKGCTLVDTTCGSVLNVWKNVRRYAQDGFTAVIHGKVDHEETRATASQATQQPGGHYLVVRDEDEAGAVCSYIRHGGDARAFLRQFSGAASPGFDPDRHLQRVGCANQTTMLMTESLRVGELFRQAMADRFGKTELATRFRAFDTICSATQERQDAVIAMLDAHQVDLAVVIGGYNSSNTLMARCRPVRRYIEPGLPNISRSVTGVGRLDAPEQSLDGASGDFDWPDGRGLDAEQHRGPGH